MRSRRGRSSRAVATVLVVVTATLAACGGGRPTRIEADPVAAAAATASAVELLAIGCRVDPVRGAGAVVSDGSGNAWVLTAAHVVAGATSIVISTSDRSVHAVSATVVALDPANDLALLRAPVSTPALILAPALAVRGDRGATVVFDDRQPTTLAYEIGGRASVGIDDIYRKERSKRSGYRVDIEIDLGDSGAVLVDRDGHALGVLYAKSLTDDGSAFATDTGAIVELLGAAAAVDPGEGIDSGECAAS